MPRTGKIQKANVIDARDTEATYFDRNGVLQRADPHQYRYSKDFATGKMKLLLEKQSKNWWPNSVHPLEITAGIGFTTDNATVTQIDSAMFADAYSVTDIAGKHAYMGLGLHRSYPGVFDNDYSDDTDFVVRSLFVRPVEANYVSIGVWNSQYSWVMFNIKTGAISDSQKHGISGISISTHELQNGWYRVQLVLAGSSSNYTTGFTFGASPTGSHTYDMQGQHLIDFALPQAEYGSEATSPILTDGTTKTRAADELVFAE
jgi:hypothetical protein